MKIAQYVKGKTSRKILQENPRLNKQFWGRHLWSRGYFCATSGAITDEMIIKLAPYGRTRALDRRTPSCSHYILDIPLWA